MITLTVLYSMKNDTKNLFIHSTSICHVSTMCLLSARYYFRCQGCSSEETNTNQIFCLYGNFILVEQEDSKQYKQANYSILGHNNCQKKMKIKQVFVLLFPLLYSLILEIHNGSLKDFHHCCKVTFSVKVSWHFYLSSQILPPSSVLCLTHFAILFSIALITIFIYFVVVYLFIHVLIYYLSPP